MKLSPAMRAKRNELIDELHRANPGQPYTWAVEEGCRIVRETIAAATFLASGPPRTAAPELTAADFASMPADQLAALILQR